MSAFDLLPSPTALAAFLFVISLLLVIRKRATTPNLPLPPGPPSDSIFGNTWPTAFGYRKFEEWTKEYGPVFSLRQGLTHIVVIGRYDAAVDIMEKEGAFTLDRPRQIAAGETLSGGMRLLIIPAGERFKKLRRALQSHLQPKNITTYHSTIERIARTFMLDLVQDPSRHQEHARKNAASIVLALAYGKIPKSYDDPVIRSVNTCLTRLGLTMRPGAWKVDNLPLLKYVPGYLKELQQGHTEELDLFKGQLQDVREKLERNEEVPPCFGKYVVENQASLSLSDSEAAYLAGSMFGAGSDTQASAVSVAIMAAAAYPEAQRLVREELDTVVGRGRPPVFADEANLPKTMAFVLESFRWRPVTAGGSPHKATKDIIWNGYLIPKNSTLIGNVWSVGRDPAYFPDPESFDPLRWLTPEGKLRDDLKSYPFGFGRRVCPGQHMATAVTFINIALVLWAYTLSEDPNQPIDVLAFTESANAHPCPFKVVFEPRLAGGVESIKEAFEEYGM